MKYDILIRPLHDDEGGGYVGYVPDLQGCMSDGDTPEEALKNTLEAMDEWLELQSETQRPIPQPGDAVKRHQKREEALISAIHVLSERNGALEEHVEEIEKAMSDLLDLVRENTGWSFPALSKSFGDNRCDA